MHAVVFRQSFLPDPKEESGALPLLKTQMDGTRTSKIAGQSLPLDAGSQYVDDRLEDLAGWQWLASASRLALVNPATFPLTLYGHVGCDFLPKLVGYGP